MISRRSLDLRSHGRLYTFIREPVKLCKPSWNAARSSILVSNVSILASCEWPPTVPYNLDVGDTLLARSLLDRGEETGLLTVMMFCHKCMPCEAIANEVCNT